VSKREKFVAKGAALANIILAGAGAVCLLALAYFVYYYAWTGQRQFTGWTGALLYYVSPALLAALCFASLRLSALHKINLAFFLCSAGLSVCALETLLTLWSSLPSVMEQEQRQMKARAAQALGADFDSRSREQFVEDLRRQRVDVVPSIYGQAFLKPQNGANGRSPLVIDGTEVLPLAGVSNKLVVLCNEAGQYVTYRSDGHGFHNPAGIWDRAPIRIAALGDSFVQGYCVRPDETFVARIRERHAGTLNLGIEGNGPLLMLASLQEYAATFKPKVVLWFYFEGNDLVDLSAEARNPILKDYLDKSTYKQGLTGRQAQIDRALLDYLETLRSKTLLQRRLQEIGQLIRKPQLSPGRILNVLKLSQLRNRLGLIYGEEDETKKPRNSVMNTEGGNRPILDLFTQILIAANREVASWGGKLYFVYLPGWEPYGAPDRAEPNRGRVLKIVQSVGLPLIDIHETFTRQSDPLDLFPFRLPAHYNEKGNRLVADAVLQAISVD
jgi:hypothetical protein